MGSGRFLTLIAFVVAATAVRPLFFLAAPGVLFALWPRKDELGPGERLALALGGATAFWVVAFWFLDLAEESQRRERRRRKRATRRARAT